MFLGSISGINNHQCENTPPEADFLKDFEVRITIFLRKSVDLHCKNSKISLRGFPVNDDVIIG